MPTSIPPSDFFPIDFQKYGATGLQTRVHLAMGLYLEPMVLVQSGKKISTAVARQVRHRSCT